MHEKTFNPVFIRVVVLVVFLIITQIMRVVNKAKPPAKRDDQGSPLESLRVAIRQATEQIRAGASESRADGQSPSVDEKFQQPRFQQSEFNQPPATEPESSFIPSLLLLALLGCLCLMAYRHWAG
jgi:hypothetical protein